jgi:hypothetical protein
LIRFSPSLSLFSAVSISVTHSVIADVDIRRNLFVTTVLANVQNNKFKSKNKNNLLQIKPTFVSFYINDKKNKG